MQTITISGNLGKDAEIKQTQGGDDVLSFSVAVKQGYGDRATSNWFRCSVWGKRGRTLQQYLAKGAKVVVQGELTIGEYQGKPQFDVRVNEVEFMSRGDGDGQQQSRKQQSSGYSADDLNDSVPF